MSWGSSYDPFLADRLSCRLAYADDSQRCFGVQSGRAFLPLGGLGDFVDRRLVNSRGDIAHPMLYASASVVREVHCKCSTWNNSRDTPIRFGQSSLLSSTKGSDQASGSGYQRECKLNLTGLKYLRSSIEALRSDLCLLRFHMATGACSGSNS